MRNICALLFSVVLVALLFSCATAEGTALVTGTKRPATNPNEVAIYTEAPEKYDVIGIVNASSDYSGNAQSDLNYAMEELKKQASKIGANGIIIEDVGKSTSDALLMYGVLIPITAQNLSGKAIYVEQ